MKISQISVFLNNQKGRLGFITKILADGGVNIKSLCIAETEKYGVLRILVDKTEIALNLLKENNVVCEETRVVAVEVPDAPGGLHGVLSVFEENDLNVEYIYALVDKSNSNPVMIMKVADVDSAISIITRNGLKCLSADKIFDKK